MRKLILLAAMLAMALMIVAAPAMAQQAGIVEGPESKVEDGKASAKVSEDVWAKSDPCPEAQAGGAKAKAECPPPKPAPPPPPKAAAPPAPPPPPAAPPPPPKPLPPTGGVGSASLLALGAGALLVGGGLLARRFFN